MRVPVEGGASPRATNLLIELNNLRDDVDRNNVSTGGDLTFDSIGKSLNRLASGRAVAKLVGSQELSNGYKYENSDPEWIQCLFEYVSSRPVYFPTPSSGEAIYPLIGTGDIKIALAGDWGTYNDPAKWVAQHIAEARPDYSIHLGDVYYAGLPKDENALLMECWPKGRAGTFALNSNHEMYCGGKGYFEVIRNAKFSNRGFSYFALHNDDWLIVGLDTAYFAYKRSLLYEDGCLSNNAGPKGNVQTNWLTNLLATPEHNRKHLIVLTRHDGFDVSSGAIQTKSLYDEVLKYMGRKRDFYWYWGHVHGVSLISPSKLMAASYSRDALVTEAFPTNPIPAIWRH